MQSPRPGKTSAPYGQACQHCVKAKSRCMLRADGRCERCHRLDKDCVPSASVRKKNVKQNKVSKRAQLEDKLDDLVTLLRTQQAALPQESSVNQQIVTPSSLDFSPQQESDTSCESSITDVDLASFRELHLPSFPLIHLPLSLRAGDLLQEKPMLALAIKTLSNKANVQQLELSERLRREVALKLFVDGEKSLDLLLSLLVCMAWSVYFTSGKKFLVMFSSVVRSLVSDLRVDRARFPAWCPSIAPTCEEGVEQSNESRRTLLACYAMTAIVSMTFKSEMMAWSPQLEENCAKLLLEAEIEADLILIAIVRISRICLQATEVHRYLADHNYSHVSLHIEPLKIKLEELKGTLSELQRGHETIRAYLFATEIAIYELAIHFPPSSVSNTQSVLDHRRTDYLVSCLRACEDYTECYLSSDIVKVTTACGLLFSYCLKTLHKLSTLRDPMWDPATVKQTIDVVNLLERCADAADTSNTNLKKQTGEDSVFLTAAKILREMASSWRHTVAQDSPVGGDAVIDNWATVEPMDLSLLDLPDDFWLNTPFDV